MKLRLLWPWHRREVPTSGREAVTEVDAAKALAQAKMRAQQRKWPEVLRARDELGRLAEQAMRGHR